MILATRAALKRTNGEYTEEKYYQRKLELFNRIQERRLSNVREQALLSFLLDYQPLKDKTLKNKLYKQLKERSQTMGTRDYLINKGREEGLREGLEKGIEKGRLLFVRYLLESTDFNDEKIASLAGDKVSRVKSTRASMEIN